MAWYYHLNGANQGPVEAADLHDLLLKNVITSETPVWTEGMAQWEPYRSSTAVPADTIMGLSHGCVECGRRFPEEEMLQYENKWVCAACKPLFFQRIKEGVIPQGGMNYASIGKRFVAVFIDGIIIVIIVVVALIPLMTMATLVVAHPEGKPETMAQSLSIWWNLLIIALEYGLPAAYETFFIGKFGATPGKMVMKIKVVTADGGRVSYLRALGRHFAKYISELILFIGYLMAFWDEEKRALHDRMCHTRVVDNTVS